MPTENANPLPQERDVELRSSKSQLQDPEGKSIDRLPYDVAVRLSDFIFDWAEGFQPVGRLTPDSGPCRGTMGICEEIMARDSTFKSLSSLNTSSRNTWLEFFVRNLRIETQDLPSVLDLFTHYPHLGKHVEHLTFRDNPLGIHKNHSLVSEEEKTNNTTIFMILTTRGKIDSESLKKTKQAISNQDRHCRVTSFFIAQRLRGFCDSIGSSEEQEDVNVSTLRVLAKGGLALSFKVLFIARGWVIQQCPNLKSLTTDGVEATFPFISRTETVGDQLLKGLSSNSLTSLSLGKGIMDQKTSLSCMNIVWLLLNLPQITKADLFGYIDQDGVNFLDNHLQFIDPKHKSNLTDLTLRLQIHRHYISMDDSVADSYRNILSLTPILEMLSLGFYPNDSFEVILDPSILQTLDSTFLRRLEINSINFDVEEDPSSFSLASMEKVEELAFDVMFCLNYARYIKTEEGTTLGDKLPPNLNTIHLTQNFVRHEGGKNRAFVVEEDLSDLVREMERGPSNIKLKSIKTSELPKDENFVIRTAGLEEPRWIKARNLLKKACETKGLELIYY